MNPEILKSGDVALAGLCSDANSSFLRGAAQAPGRIRECLHSESANGYTEAGVQIVGHPRFVNVGDWAIADDVESFMAIESHVGDLLRRGAKPLLLGGDHAITYPVLRAVAAHYGGVDILHFDAHPDLYSELLGNRLSHACPFARIMEEGLARRLVQVGIRTATTHQREQAEKFGVEIHDMKDFDANTFAPAFDGPLYISFDIDGLDPAFAPGVSHPEPGGLSVRDALTVIQAVDTAVIGADVVEYNPLRDVNDMTAMVAAKLVKEIAAKMVA